jgi:uncharacterized protein YwqG
MFTSREQIEASLCAAGVSTARAADYAAKAKTCVRLETLLLPEGDVSLGGTKIGGHPDLPAGMEWPLRPPYQNTTATAEAAANITADELRKVYEDLPRVDVDALIAENADKVAAVAEARPLSFVAQLNLAQIHGTSPLDPDIPDTGRLLFFYDAQQQPWGFSPGDAAGWKLLYDTTTPAALMRTMPPSGPGQAQTVVDFRALRCRGQAALSPVPEDEVTLPVLDQSDPDQAALAGWYEELNVTLLDRTDWRACQAGGHPDQIQGGMQLQCQLASNGIDRGGDHPGDPASISRLAKGAEDWLLLMQIDSDARNVMLWGDAGMLYVWIHRSDLRARRFDRAWVVLQCL